MAEKSLVDNVLLYLIKRLYLDIVCSASPLGACVDSEERENGCGRELIVAAPPEHREELPSSEP